MTTGGNGAHRVGQVFAMRLSISLRTLILTAVLAPYPVQLAGVNW